MRFLKCLCCVLGFIFAVCLVTVPFAYEAGTVKDWRVAAALIVTFFMLILACFCGYGAIRDHESIEWTEFLKENSAQKSNGSVRRIRKFPK